MSTSLATTLELVLNALLTKTNALGGTNSAPVSLDIAATLSNGSGAGQASSVYDASRTLTATTSETLDLNASLTDEFGATLSFTRICAIVIVIDTANASLKIGGAASNAFATIFADSSDKLIIRSGTAGKGLLLLITDDATGFVVTAATGDQLKIENPGGTSVTYRIVIIGSP